MTVDIFDLGLYAGGIFILFLTPGPVWMAIVARTLSGGIGSRLAIGTWCCRWRYFMANPGNPWG